MYSQIIPSGNALLSCDEYLSNKCEDIHKQVYDEAIMKFLTSNPEYSGYDIQEIRNKDWKTAPHILLTSTKFPFKRKQMSLENYWDMSFMKNVSSSWEDIITDEDSMIDAEITSIDYVNGKVNMTSKLTGNEFQVGFDRLNENTKVNDDACTLIGSFTYMANNL